MQMIRPTPLRVRSTNVTETVATYSSATSYAVGAYARIAGVIYKSLIASNINNYPPSNINTKWLKWGVSNAYAMFDLASGTVTSKLSGDLVVEVYQDGMETLVIGGYSAANLKVEVVSSVGVLLWETTTATTNNDSTNSWWEWLEADYGYDVDRAIVFKLGWVAEDAYIRVTFLYDGVLSDRTACSFLVGGVPNYLGDTLYGVSSKFNSFSTKSFDSFGDLSIVTRKIQDTIDFNTVVLLADNPLMPIKRLVKKNYDAVCVFILDDSEDSRYENMVTLGVIQDVSITLNNGTIAEFAWSIAEVV